MNNSNMLCWLMLISMLIKRDLWPFLFNFFFLTSYSFRKCPTEVYYKTLQKS